MDSVRASKEAKFWVEMGKVRDREIHTERFTQTPRETERQRQKRHRYRKTRQSNTDTEEGEKMRERKASYRVRMS